MNEDYIVLVCNDGSRDNTQAMLEQYADEMPIEIIQHKINRGLGESSRDLFERVSLNRLVLIRSFIMCHFFHHHLVEDIVIKQENYLLLKSGQIRCCACYYGLVWKKIRNMW